MKKITTLILAIVLLLCASPNISLASQSPDKEMKIKPLKVAPNSKAVLEKAQVVTKGDTYTIQVSGVIKPGDKIVEVTVDPSSLTYSTTESDSGNVYIPGTGNKTVYSRAKTIDPVEWPVCETKLQFNYYNSGTTITPTSRQALVWDANPSPINTHWFCSSKNASGSGSDAYASGNHYNYDFADTSARTDVYHYVSLSVTPDGDVYWYGEATISGDSSSLLTTLFQPIW